MPSLLLVEDDAAIRRGLGDACRHAGYRVSLAASGDEGIAMGLRGEHDLVLLDLLLPGASGRDVLSAIRAARPTMPVIILTAFASEDDRVALLALGADDYVTKPFSIRELLARIGAVLRRSPGRPSDIDTVAFAHGRIALERCEVTFHDGAQVLLGTREAQLLRYLARYRGRVVGRAELLRALWGIEPHAMSGASASRSVDMLVARLRDKLRDDPERPSVVVTVRGKGYMLAAGP